MVTLVLKLLRDIRLPLLVVALLLMAFQCIWVKITQRIVGQLMPFFSGLAVGQKLVPAVVQEQLFRGPGKLLQTLIGGESIQLDRAMDVMSIGYIHPLMPAIFCIWAIGRAAGAIAGEIDRGTMELLLAQPVPRYRVLLAHLCVDGLTIPLLCLSLWAGTWLGLWVVGPIQVDPESVRLLPPQLQVEPSPEALHVDPADFGPGLWNVGALIFAIGGSTMWLSARGRFQGRVLGVAVLLNLVQFLINVVGQLWDAAAWLRPFTLFYYYQPQQVLLTHRWTVELGTVWNGGQPLLAVNVLAVLFTVGGTGYLLALWTFCRRDLPAPL